MTRYNLALVPKNISNFIVNLIINFNSQTHTYCLGKNSIPHITIAQFEANEREVELIWHQVCESKWPNVYLNLNAFSNLTFDNSIYWISLLPESKEVLIEIFNKIKKLVSPLRQEDYDPHLTLFNYLRLTDKMIDLVNQQITITDEFEITLGFCDEFGQLNNVLKKLIINEKPKYST